MEATLLFCFLNSSTVSEFSKYFFFCEVWNYLNYPDYDVYKIGTNWHAKTFMF
jgi:hypothetical protein